TIDRENNYYEQSLFSYGIENEKFSLETILAILNSKVANFLLKENAFSRKETFTQIRLHWLKEFPIPKNSNSPEIDNKVNVLYNEFTQLKKCIEQFGKYINSKYTNLSSTKKLENWHELDFADFIN